MFLILLRTIICRAQLTCHLVKKTMVTRHCIDGYLLQRSSPPPNTWEEVAVGEKNVLLTSRNHISFKSAPPSATTHSKKNALIENGLDKHYHLNSFSEFRFQNQSQRQLLNNCSKLYCSPIFRNIFESFVLYSLHIVLTVWSSSHRQTQTRSLVFVFQS